MKILWLNKAYAAQVHLGALGPCNQCMYHSTNCNHIPRRICVLYGGFQVSDTKIFTL